jgi:hypothetical protein
VNSVGFNPDSWMDVAVIVVVALIAAIPSWLAHRNHKVTKDIQEQVKNRHATNLRDDIDRAISAVEALAHDVRALKSDLLAESDHRRLQISDLRDELDHRDRRHPRSF